MATSNNLLRDLIFDDDNSENDSSSEYSEGDEEFEQKEEGYYYQNCEKYQTEEHFDEESEIKTSCDTCDRSFSTPEQLKKHLEQHRVCGIDGCQFVAHEKVVEKHIEMQHVTGLYYRIKKTETPEDIAKWIAERKRRYPSKENIEKRQQEQEERMKRGERLTKSKNRFDKKTKKVLGPVSNIKKRPKQLKSVKKPSEKPFVSLLSSKENWNGNMPPFSGTQDLYEDEEKNSKIEIIDIDDEVWTHEKTEEIKIPISNALGALIGAYRSSDESDEEIYVPKVPESSKTSAPNLKPELEEIKSNQTTNEEPCENLNVDETFEPPEEVKITKENQFEPVKTEEEPSVSNVRVRKRKRQHNKNKIADSNQKNTTSNNQTKSQKSQPSTPRLRKRKVTLLERLLEPEIRHERNIILQCIRYVVDNNFFEKSDVTKTSTEETLKETAGIEIADSNDRAIVE